jgi:hypothetical protein
MVFTVRLEYKFLHFCGLESTGNGSFYRNKTKNNENYKLLVDFYDFFQVGINGEWFIL